MEKNKIYLVTKNIHKVEEIKTIMKEFNIEVEQIADEKFESKDMDLKEVAEYNAKFFYEKYKKPVAIDDTGVFFKAYNDFPGSHPKLMFELLGYKGLLKLLENESKKAEFKTVVGYCDKNGIKVFEGILEGEIDSKVHDESKDVLPYERIFLVNKKPISAFSREEKNKISHRAVAFRKLGDYLRKVESKGSTRLSKGR
jgi:XTP/dITP diphosphohydrolase